MPSSSQILHWVVITLLAFAVVMISSAALKMNSSSDAFYGPIILTELIYALAAIGVMLFVTYALRTRWLYCNGSVLNPMVLILIVSIGLCIYILIPGLGHTKNESTRWFRITEDFGFQPSELAKWAMVGVIAWWGARLAGNIRRFWTGFFPVMVLVGIVCGLIAVQDLGTAAVIGAVAIIMLIAAGARWWHVGIMLAPSIVAFWLLTTYYPYRLKRITAFLDPYNDPRGEDYQLIESLIAISEGGIAGRGIGNSIQKYEYLPEDTTDFIFSVVCSEMGILGAVFVIGLYLLLFFTGFAVIRDCRNSFARLLSFGIMMTLALQAIINMGVVTGLLPTKGIALPFISHGGTGWVMAAAAVGLLAGVDRMSRQGLDSPVIKSGYNDQASKAEMSVSAVNY